MRLLPFEEWLRGQLLPQEAVGLFIEAVVCYKASAYRAALLLSYLGFQATIRDRILRAQKPSKIPDGPWNQVQAALRSDDRWDSAVFDAIQRQQPAEIFLLSDDLRNQVQYFKNRRNDCAHGKDNRIDFAHVEAFWSFVQSNLPKFVVNESRDDLLNRIRGFYDRTITPPNADLMPLVSEIPAAIEPDQRLAFFQQVGQLSVGAVTTAVSMEEKARFFSAVLDLEDGDISGKLVTFLKGDENLLLNVLRSKPQRVVFFRHDTALIRRLWYEHLFTGGPHREDFGILAAMLRNGLIPDGQRDETFERVTRRLAGQVPEERYRDTLESNGFFRSLGKEAFEEQLIVRFSWANANSQLILYYLDTCDIDDKVAKALSEAFSSTHYPWTLCEHLNEYLKTHAKQRDQLVQAMRRLPSVSIIVRQLAPGI